MSLTETYIHHVLSINQTKWRVLNHLTLTKDIIIKAKDGNVCFTLFKDRKED